MWARERCWISPFLAKCCKRQLNQDSFVLLYFRLFTFSDLYWVCSSVFSCTVLFASISQVIGCEDRLRNDLYCVEWGVKLYSNQHITFAFRIHSSHILQSWDFSCIFSTSFFVIFFTYSNLFLPMLFSNLLVSSFQSHYSLWHLSILLYISRCWETNTEWHR